jgi:hypothetical protein
MDRKVKRPAARKTAPVTLKITLSQKTIAALALLNGGDSPPAGEAAQALTLAAEVFTRGAELRGWEHDATIHIFGDDWIPKLPNKCQWCKAPFPDDRERHPIRQCCGRGNEADLRAMAKR